MTTITFPVKSGISSVGLYVVLSDMLSCFDNRCVVVNNVELCAGGGQECVLRKTNWLFGFLSRLP